MQAADIWIRRSQKAGLISEESHIVGRGDQVYLRILGKQPTWQVMTATAGEDDGTVGAVSDRAALVEAAFKIGHRRQTQPVAKRDLKGRDYVLICELHQRKEESDDQLNEELHEFISEFFCVFDEREAEDPHLREELIEIYRALSSEFDGEDIYLSDGVWLSSDGFTEDRGR
ncbi:hypothetical protein [Porphyrobacter sp. CACIAM 03H1]|uniref:hypothetical protein n=1 Tax=Porphyrobacter sp. CACIAM 03H1 TaxID=2003315 RepID=UPI0012FDAA59|nr:hypothetical protein [Porphyrobacter sp. CACIAM 03H1]